MIKKILCIDGGGIKGVFAASFLASIEKQIDGTVAEYFDLIVGTSTGGIIALNLGLENSSQETLDFYKNYGKSIFAGNPFLKFGRHLFYSKYDQKELKLALENTFGTKKLGDSKKRLVIPSLDLNTGTVYIHKTSHHERFSIDYQRSIVDVALSTSAAPTFFPAHLLQSGAPLVDGGLWANNPTGMAVVEAIGILDWPKESLQILSIGCTSTPINKVGFRKGKLYWATKATDLFMRAQDSASMGTAAVLCSHEQIKRIDPEVSPGRFMLDSYKAIPQLEGLGETCAREQFPKIKYLFSDKVESFSPYHNQY
ncbi:MAG: patatin-like phospholipase family protein [Bacteroidetes bacterium]|nr:patatin-like phospholipase family protein [Bacteroidota bacterium]